MIKKYIDSNIFLNALLYEDKKANACKKILDELTLKKFQGITSMLTWDEVVFILKKNLGRDIAIKEGEKFLKMPNLDFSDVNKRVISKAQSIMAKHPVNPRDAIHMASAFLNKAQVIISDDTDFDKIKELKRVSP